MLRFYVTALAVVVSSSCAGGSSSGPFGALPGATREAAASALNDRGFCSPDKLREKRVTFPRCPQPGLELYVSRVEVTFEKDILTRARRIEEHAAEDQAMRRWHDLVAERSADGRERARNGSGLLRASGDLPDGAVSWVVWKRSGYLHAVVLVRPSNRESFEVVEVVSRAER